MSDKKTGLDLLREPFPSNQISKLCRSTKKDNPKGSCKVCGGWHGQPFIALDYVGHAALTNRLLDTDPTWTWEPLALGPDGYPVIDKDGGMWIRLTVCGITRLGYGDAQGKTGGDAMKERIGDALRNAAMRFGAALDLWHKGELHVDEEPEKTGKSEQSKPGKTGQQPKPADTPPASETAEKDKEYLQRGVAALTELFGTPEKRDRIPAFIEARTTFPEKKDGKETGRMVAGVKQLKVLTGKRLEIFVHGVEKTLDDVKNTRVCPDCFDKTCKCPDPF